MKKLLLFFCLFLSVATASSQQARLATSFTAAGNNGGVRLIATGVAYSGAVWSKTGTVTVCSFVMDSSVDRITWNSGDVLGATDCSVNGVSAYTNVVANYVRVRVTSFTGTGTVNIVQLGYILNPTPSTGITNSAGANVVTKSNGTNLVASSITDNGTNVTTTEAILAPNGTRALPAFAFANFSANGFYVNTNFGVVATDGSGNDSWGFNATGITFVNNTGIQWKAAASPFTGTAADTGVGRGGVGIVSADTTTVGNGLGTFVASAYTTKTNCANGASPAVCVAAASGAVAVPTGTNPTLVINTTAVTASSRIFLAVDESLTISATTCNTTLSTLVQPVVTARTAGTSFTIQIGAVIASNPACVSYFIVN